MIQILEPGKKMYRKRCRYCQCLFSFEEEDIIKVGTEHTIACPYCKGALKVTDYDIIRLPKSKDEHELHPQTVEAINCTTCVHCYNCPTGWDCELQINPTLNYAAASHSSCTYYSRRLNNDKDIVKYPEDKKEYEFPPQTVEAISGVSPV